MEIGRLCFGLSARMIRLDILDIGSFFERVQHRKQNSWEDSSVYYVLLISGLFETSGSVVTLAICRSKQLK